MRCRRPGRTFGHQRRRCAVGADGATPRPGTSKSGWASLVARGRYRRSIRFKKLHWIEIMIEPKQSDIGRKVIYRVHSAQAVEGVITHFNEKYVFVRFGKEEKSVVTTQDELEWKDSRFSS